MKQIKTKISDLEKQLNGMVPFAGSGGFFFLEEQFFFTEWKQCQRPFALTLKTELNAIFHQNKLRFLEKHDWEQSPFRYRYQK